MKNKWQRAKKRKLDRVGFLGDYVMAFKNEIHTYVTVKPGDNGPGILAHKCVLAVRSNVFKYMLDSDECKTSVENTITIPDLTYEELKALLEFFYSGISSPANKHARTLYLAAHKYDIPYLQELCRDQFISSLNLSNVLDILELSSVPSDKILKEAAIRFVVMNIKTACCLCSNVDETREHLLQFCCGVITSWRFGQKFRGSRSGFQNFFFQSWACLLSWMKESRTYAPRTLRKLVAQATIYTIWKERNNRVFTYSAIPSDHLFREIDRLVKNSISARRSTSNWVFKPDDFLASLIGCLGKTVYVSLFLPNFAKETKN